MKKYFRIPVLFALIAGLSGIALADQTDYTKTVDKLGIQNGTVYFSVVETLGLACQYNVIYFNSDTTFGKSAWNVLLAAKFTGRALSRIDYTQDPTTHICTLTLVEMQN